MAFQGKQGIISVWRGHLRNGSLTHLCCELRKLFRSENSVVSLERKFKFLLITCSNTKTEVHHMLLLPCFSSSSQTIVFQRPNFPKANFSLLFSSIGLILCFLLANGLTFPIPIYLFYPLSLFLLQKCSWKSWHHHTVMMQEKRDGIPSLAHSMDMCTLSSLWSHWKEMSIVRVEMPWSVLDYALCWDETHLDSLMSKSIRDMTTFN